MEKFKATTYEEDVICLENSEELDKLYHHIEGDDNFILQWIDKNDVLQSEVIITTNISSKVKNGELKLMSREEYNKE